MEQILLACVGILLFASCNDQKSIPVYTKTAFETKYPLAEDVEWEKEEDEEYEVEFEIDGKEMTSIFSSKGKWLETEFEIEENDIPENIKEAIKLKYRGYEIVEAEMIETPDMKEFEIVLKDSQREREIVYNIDGVLLSEK